MVFLLFVAKLKSFFVSNLRYAPAVAYVGVIALFLWICSQFYLPGRGFTYLIQFGSLNHERYLPELQAVNHFELPKASGYDGQSYAQIAMRPSLSDPALRSAVDNLAYRARRILLCWTAYALAGGDPVRALHIFAVQNIIGWFGLAILLLRWFPPNNWGNWARWSAVLFSFGLCTSVRGSLVDGPSLLLIAGAVALLESGRPWLSACLLGLSGLAKETNLLATAAFWPAEGSPGRWRRACALALLAAIPLAAWILVLAVWLGPGGAGVRNFAFPLAGFWGKWAETFGQWSVHGFNLVTRANLLILIALTTQALFIALRPRWREPWWRIGAAYGALMIFLGDAVWEGYPGAAPRVLLPLTLAFNLLVPRRKAWWMVLLLGNLSLLVSPDALPFPGRESFVVSGPRALRIVPVSGRTFEAIFDDQWYRPEKSWLEFWRWNRGPATITLRNPHSFAVTAEISFGLRARDQRTVDLRQGSQVLWSGALHPGELRQISLPPLRLEPGDTVWHFGSDAPPLAADARDDRDRAFSLRNLHIALLGHAGGGP